MRCAEAYLTSRPQRPRELGICALIAPCYVGLARLYRRIGKRTESGAPHVGPDGHHLYGGVAPPRESPRRRPECAAVKEIHQTVIRDIDPKAGRATLNADLILFGGRNWPGAS